MAGPLTPPVRPPPPSRDAPTLAAVAAGGATGAAGRYAAGGWVVGWAGGGWPWGTLLVNVAGAFLLGALVHALPRRAVPPAVQAGLTVGLCGGFTTFSAFGHETAALLRGGAAPAAALYVAASLALGLLAVALGERVGARAGGRRGGGGPPSSRFLRQDGGHRPTAGGAGRP